MTELLALEFDTTIHFAAVHVHPFAEFVELNDLTEGKTILRANVKDAEDRIGLAHIDYISSPEGIPVYKDHDYELVAGYDNTSGEVQDSMAVMFLYLLDKRFRRDAVSFAPGK